MDVERWAGGIAQERARIPQVRLGRSWITTLWLVPIAVAGGVVAVLVARQLRTVDWVQSFIANHPGTSAAVAPPVEQGFPWWLRWQHYFNAVLMLFIIRSGLQILADHPRLYLDAGSRPGREWFRMRGPVPSDGRHPDDRSKRWTAKDDSVGLPSWLGLPGIRHSIGLARWWHLGSDTLWLINGAVFYILLFASGQWARIVPRSLEVFPDALSTAIQYASLDFPTDRGFTQYNGLQLLAYFLTVFVAAPLAFATGLLQAPAIAARFGLAAGRLNRQVARTVHFAVLAWMVVFIAMHTAMVFATGAVRNLNHITLGTDTTSSWALLLYGVGMAVIVGLWLAASPFTLRHPGLVQRAGRSLIGWIKGGLEHVHPDATYTADDISPYLWSNGRSPESADYRRLGDGGWVDYRLTITGLVANPVELTYADLLAMPKHDQITQHYCIQGWSGIAKWGGVAMADLLELARPLPEARWVVFTSLADGSDGGRYYDCHRIEHMRHPLSILAYEMNDQPLPEDHGAPLRLRNEVELGFKQVKWVAAIELVESFDHIGAGQGGYNEDHEFFGYRMPI